MEANPSVPPVRIEKPIWKRTWFWVIAAGVACFVGLVILGLLATLVVPHVLQKVHVATRKKAESDIIEVRNALTEYALANGGRFPDSLGALVTPDVNGRTYLDSAAVPKDPWGRTYVYEPPRPGHPRPTIRSYGRDGEPGGEGDDADVDDRWIDAAK